MHYRHMGMTGLRVSEICLGTMTFGVQADKREAFRIIDTAVDVGVNFIDTADGYPVGSEARGRTEEILGEWLAQRARESLVVATKCAAPMGPGPNDRGASRTHILSAVDASLRRLGTEYIDLYQIHFPDRSTPQAETLRALDDLVRAGKVRYIGVSNYQAWEMALALGISDRMGLTRIQCDQPRYNILFREIENEIVPLCRHEGIGVIAYNPLAGGMLTGKYKATADLQEGTRFTMVHGAGSRYRDRYWDDAHFVEVQRLAQYFSERDVSLTHAAIAWVLAQDGITSAIVGASRAEQMVDSLPAADLTLSTEDLAFCDEAWYNLPRRHDLR